LVVGVAGAGKTHLIVRELSKFSHPIYSALIFSPEAHIDFPIWFERHLVSALLRPITGSGDPTSLHRLRRHLLAETATSFQKRLTDFLRKVDADRNVLAMQRSVDEAARQHSIGRVARGLYHFASNERYLSDLADEFAGSISIDAIPGSREFAAALLLLDGALTSQAANWLTSGAPPSVLGAWRVEPGTTPASRNTAAIITALLRRLGGCLIICFDQLERLAASEADGGALTKLLRSSIELLRQHSNFACIVAALPDVALQAMHALDDPERHRITSSPDTQNLPLLRPREVPSFLEPRFAHLAKVAPDTDGAVKLLRQFALWLGTQRIGAQPPRLILRAMEQFGRKCRYDDDGDPRAESFMQDVWTEAEGAFGQGPRLGQGTPAQPNPEVSEIDRVELEWQHFQARDVASRPYPEGTGQLGEYLDWALKNIVAYLFGVAAIHRVSRTEWKELCVIDFSVEFQGGDVSDRRVFLVDATNYAGRLVAQLTNVANHDTRSKKIVLRPYDPLPSGRTSRVTPVVDRIRRAGGSVLTLETAEAMSLVQAKKFRASVAEMAWRNWIASKVPYFQTIEQLVAQ
jgi:hypothetical protein